MRKKIIAMLMITLVLSGVQERTVSAESSKTDVIVDMTTGKGNAGDKPAVSQTVPSGESTNGGIFGGYDEEKPVIKGAKSMTIIVGRKMNFRKGITVIDEWDGNITKKLKINSKNVNLNKAGKYKVVYSATDKEGNKATKSITVTVKKATK